MFGEFLRQEYSEENMLFWAACEDLKQESDSGVLHERAHRIYEDYISVLSPKEVYFLLLGLLTEKNTLYFYLG